MACPFCNWPKPPEAVTEAFDDVIKARKDEKRFINEADAYASQYNTTVVGEVERLLREAEGEKERLVADALADVAQFKALKQLYRAQPEVMKTRLYLDAFESILTKSSKVLVATKGGQNILYLPLDKIMESQRQNAREDGISIEGVTASNGSEADLPADATVAQVLEDAEEHRRDHKTIAGGWRGCECRIECLRRQVDNTRFDRDELSSTCCRCYDPAAGDTNRLRRENRRT